MPLVMLPTHFRGTTQSELGSGRLLNELAMTDDLFNFSAIATLGDRQPLTGLSIRHHPQSSSMLFRTPLTT
jgi:hypothetical protein